MSASEKLKALDLQPFATVINDGDGREAVAIDLDRWRVFQAALPQIVAVVEAAEAVEFQQHEPWSPEYQDITTTLAALEEVLS